MAEKQRVFQQFHYSSANQVIGVGNTHGWGIVSSSQMENMQLNEAITEKMASEYPIAKEKEFTEYMVYLARYGTFISIGLSNSNSVNNGRDNRFGHIYMPVTENCPEKYQKYPENYFPDYSWQYVRDIQQEKQLKAKKSDFVQVDLFHLVKSLGFTSEAELAYFIQKVYHSVFKNAQVFYLCSDEKEGDKFRSQAKDFALLFLYLIPPKFYQGKSIAFFAETDITSNSFVFRKETLNPNSWTKGETIQELKQGYEENFYLYMAKLLFQKDSGNAYRKWREKFNYSLIIEDYDTFFPIFYEGQLLQKQEINLSAWKMQNIDGILYDVVRGKYWNLSVYVLKELSTQNYSLKKIQQWYGKWLRYAFHKDYTQEKYKREIREVLNHIEEFQISLPEELINEKEEWLEKAFPAPKKLVDEKEELIQEDVLYENYGQTSSSEERDFVKKCLKDARMDNRFFDVIENELLAITWKNKLSPEDLTCLIYEICLLYQRIIKKEEQGSQINNCLLSAFDRLCREDEKLSKNIFFALSLECEGEKNPIMDTMANRCYTTSFGETCENINKNKLWSEEKNDFTSALETKTAKKNQEKVAARQLEKRKKKQKKIILQMSIVSSLLIVFICAVILLKIFKFPQKNPAPSAKETIEQNAEETILPTFYDLEEILPSLTMNDSGEKNND